MFDVEILGYFVIIHFSEWGRLAARDPIPCSFNANSCCLQDQPIKVPKHSNIQIPRTVKMVTAEVKKGDLEYDGRVILYIIKGLLYLVLLLYHVTNLENQPTKPAI